MSNLNLVQSTFEDMGIRGFRPLGWMVLVRTYALETVTHGGVHLPPKLTKFYGELPHLQPLRGLVLAAGSRAPVEVGAVVAFQRLHFARWQAMEDGTFVGCIDYNQLYGLAE